MATVKVRKNKVASTDVAGFKRHRSELLEVAYGTIPADGYTAGDTIKFPELPANELISATFVTGDTSPNTVAAYNVTDFSSPIAVATDASGGVTIAYRLEYVRAKGASSNLSILVS